MKRERIVLAESEASIAPQITIVISTHNRPHMVDGAVRSALAQSVDDLEVVVIDDASAPPVTLHTDDPRVRLLRIDVSRGVSAARNAGLAAARGEWIAFLDDDDELLPDMVEASLQAAAGTSLPAPVAVLSGLELVNATGHTERIRIPASLPKGKHYFLEGAPKGHSFTVGSTLVIPREVLQQIGGFDEELTTSEHRELLLRVNAVCSIEALPKITYRGLRHGGPNIHGNIRARALAMERTVAKHPEIFQSHPAAFARYLSAMSVAYVRAGKWLPALRASVRAVAANPGSLKALRSLAISIVGPIPLLLYKRARIGSLVRRFQKTQADVVPTPDIRKDAKP